LDENNPEKAEKEADFRNMWVPSDL